MSDQSHLLRRRWNPADGDTRCQQCGRANPCWFTDNDLWNLVMFGPDATQDEGGVLCPQCFIARAEARNIRVVWHLAPDNPRLYRSVEP